MLQVGFYLLTPFRAIEVFIQFLLTIYSAPVAFRPLCIAYVRVRVSI